MASQGLRCHVPRGVIFEASQLALPSMPEQRAIAGVLDAIDEAIERTEAVIAATERLRDSLLHELLTRGVPGLAHGVEGGCRRWDGAGVLGGGAAGGGG